MTATKTATGDPAGDGLPPETTDAALREGAERYNFLADTVPLIIWTARPDGGLDYYNKRWFEYTGLTLAQTENWGWGAVIHPDDLQACIDRWTRSLTTGENYEIEYRFKRADGAYRWFLGRASARRNEKGEIVQWVGTCTDIEDQKRAESGLRSAHSALERDVSERTVELARTNEALQREQIEMRVLFDLMPAMIWFKDTENGILRVNKRVAEAAMKPAEEIEGRPSVEIYPQDAARFYADDLEVIRSGAPKLGFVEAFRDGEGKELWVQTDKVPYCDRDGKVIGILVMAQDITERKKADEALLLLGSAVEQCKEAVLITDAELDLPGPRILFVNPAFTKMTGYTAEEVIGKTPRMLQGPRTDKTVLRRLRQNLERGETFEGEAINYHKGGEPFNLEWQIAPILNRDGKTTHYVAVERDITERKKLEAARDRLIAILESTTNLVSISDPAGNLLYLNRSGRVLLGVGLEEDITKSCIADFLPDPANHPNLTQGIPAAIRDGTWSGECVLSSRLGKAIPVSQVILAHKTSEGVLEFLSTIVRDVTEGKRVEARLFQSQKMETVGKLAGGIAHEFNSILTAIIGQSELLLNGLGEGDPLCRNATEIRIAADRAAALTRQLLAYGRKQFLQPEKLDLNGIIKGMERIFHHLMGGEVNTQTVLAPDLHAVTADAGQIEQVIMNLAINARDAMPNGGKLTIETANVSFDKDIAARYPEFTPGDYVMLAVTDTGTGMSAEVKARVFEPFFSTKGVGKGTGLGLSTCYGIIKQSGGHITVYSEPSRGSIFRIYLPQVEQRPKAARERSRPPELPRGTETILLVEDDSSLREMATTLLRQLGYTVLAAADGIEALNLKQQRDIGHIDLLFTDVVMPHMSGKELCERVQASFPHTKILFTSAYSETAIVHQDVLNKGVALLQKPFTPSALAHKLREVLDQPKALKTSHVIA